MPKKWKTLDTKQIFGNKVFGLREDKVLSPKTENTHPKQKTPIQYGSWMHRPG